MIQRPSAQPAVADHALPESAAQHWRSEARNLIEQTIRRLHAGQRIWPSLFAFLRWRSTEEQLAALRRARAALEVAAALPGWRRYLALERSGQIEEDQLARRTAQHLAAEKYRRARYIAVHTDPARALFARPPESGLEALAEAMHSQWGCSAPTGSHVALDLQAARHWLFKWPADVDLVLSDLPSDPLLLDGARPKWRRDMAAWRRLSARLIELLPDGWSIQRVGADKVVEWRRDGATCRCWECRLVTDFSIVPFSERMNRK